MSATRISLLFAVALLAAPVSAEPIRSRVRSWITPVAGQTPFTPGPGEYVPDSAFDLSPGERQRVASFGPSDSWAPAAGLRGDQHLFVRHEYLFTYHVEVTDLASGQTGVATLPGSAFANWIQQPDGTVYDRELGVTMGPASGDLLLGGNRYTLDALAYPVGPPERASARMAVPTLFTPTQMTGADVVITAIPNPEPGTLALAAGGLVAVGAGVWRRKRAG